MGRNADDARSACTVCRVAMAWRWAGAQKLGGGGEETKASRGGKSKLDLVLVGQRRGGPWSARRLTLRLMRDSGEETLKTAKRRIQFPI